MQGCLASRDRRACSSCGMRLRRDEGDDAPVVEVEVHIVITPRHQSMAQSPAGRHPRGPPQLPARFLSPIEHPREPQLQPPQGKQPVDLALLAPPIRGKKSLEAPAPAPDEHAPRIGELAEAVIAVIATGAAAAGTPEAEIIEGRLCGDGIRSEAPRDGLTAKPLDERRIARVQVERKR